MNEENDAVEILTEIRRLKDVFAVSIRKKYPVGSLVSYKHGKQFRVATVIDHSLSGHRIKLIGTTDVGYWIDVTRCFTEEEMRQVVGVKEVCR